MSKYFFFGTPSEEVVLAGVSGSGVVEGKQEEFFWFLLDKMAECRDALRELAYSIRTKPLFGAGFQGGTFLLATHLTIQGGMHHVRYMVLEEKTWLPIGIGATKSEALGAARLFLSKIDALLFYRFCASLIEMQKEEQEAKQKAWNELSQRGGKSGAKQQPEKRVSRRRRQIFNEADGKCHYCATPLTLDGRWHVDHKMPKALGGGNEPGNLVASCAPCNHKKLDRTDVEFIAMKQAGLA